MRGWPPLEILFFVVLFAGVSIPVWKVTTGKVSPVPPASAPAGLAKEGAVDDPEESPLVVWVGLTFSHPPTACEIRSNAGEHRFGPPVALEEDAEIAVALAPVDRLGEEPGEGTDLSLILVVEWPEEEGAAERAVRVQLEVEGLDTKEFTLWGRGGIDEEIEASW